MWWNNVSDALQNQKRAIYIHVACCLVLGSPKEHRSLETGHISVKKTTLIFSSFAIPLVAFSQSTAIEEVVVPGTGESDNGS